MRILLLFASAIVLNARYHLYHSNNHQDVQPIFDCLYAHLIDDYRDQKESYISNYHLIPYCRRPDENDDKPERLLLYTTSNHVENTITFGDLKRQGVSSTQMLTWFASIDVAEHYEMSDENSSEHFFNCSPPWFGHVCQYKFGYNPPQLFRDIVQATFTYRSHTSHNVSTGTCYRFLANCDRGPWPLCLDWRQICDGYADCFDAEDELLCETLETSKCGDDEYRCHYGGQCIPIAFLDDSQLYSDCLDRSDEMRRLPLVPSTLLFHCINVPTFRCEERMDQYSRRFQCGDGESNNGQFPPSISGFCRNQRDKEFARVLLTSLDKTLNDKCQQAFYCALYNNRSYGKVRG